VRSVQSGALTRAVPKGSGERSRPWLLAVTLCALGVVMALPPATVADAGPPTRVPGVLTVGLRPSTARFQKGVVEGERVVSPRGFEVDLARAIADTLGVTVEFRYVPHAAGFLSAGPKPWDIALGRITVGAAGANQQPVVPYLQVPEGVLLRRGLTERVHSLSDLRWLTICARDGTPAAQLLKTSIRPIAAPLLVRTQSDELHMLAAGRCDAAVDNAAELAAEREVAPTRYGPLAGRLAAPEQRYGIALPTDSRLTPFVRRAIRELGARGTLRRLSRKWFGIDPQQMTILRPVRGTMTVTLIGDSVSAALNWVPSARPLLAQGLNVRFEALSCRRLAAPSCANPPPPTALQTILSDGRSLGEVVVMDIGYNDSASSYGSELDTAMRDMLAAGVHHVIWVTLRERYSNYHSTNEVIEAARHRWPQIEIADWNSYSDGKPWFAPDGIHLNTDGAFALARFLRSFLGPLALPTG
jgi:ABC-type amino acid transport substrate-binding protein